MPRAVATPTARDWAAAVRVTRRKAGPGLMIASMFAKEMPASVKA
jgi:hypothetical protein